MATKEPVTEPEAIAPRTIFVKTGTKPVRIPAGQCRWCGNPLKGGERFYHRECSLAAENRI